jgi:hypothetical protein
VFGAVAYDGHVEVLKIPGVRRMKSLVVYFLDGKWFGEEATYKRSGSGFYREYSRIQVPQSKAEIERFAAENRYRIEWRGEIPEQAATAAT